MMKPLTRILIIVVALPMLLAYFFPLWKITLFAPQYPEGLFMDIWLNQIKGDIRTINILNHYIGMAAINPESIPELRFFPYIVGIIVGLGVLAAAIGKKFLLYLWSAAGLLFGVVAFLDFWKWEYQYGHNLNPDAAIKMEGMTYTPPLIGSKSLLNIYASSWPEIGGYAIAFSVVLALVLAVLQFRKKQIQ